MITWDVVLLFGCEGKKKQRDNVISSKGSEASKEQTVSHTHMHARTHKYAHTLGGMKQPWVVFCCFVEVVCRPLCSFPASDSGIKSHGHWPHTHTHTHTRPTHRPPYTLTHRHQFAVNKINLLPSCVVVTCSDKHAFPFSLFVSDTSLLPVLHTGVLTVLLNDNVMWYVRLELKKQCKQ